MRLWDAAAGASAAAATAHSDGVVWAAWVPDATALATAGADGTLRLWRVAEGDAFAAPPQQLHELKVRHPPLLAAAEHILAPTLASLIATRCFQGHEGRCTCGAFTPDGSRLVSCGLDGTVRVWRVADGSCERVMLRHTKYITCLVRQLELALHEQALMCRAGFRAGAVA